MPLKTVKKDTADALTLEWILHVKNYKLTLDKKLCKGCQICSLACPKEAIKVNRQQKVQGEKTQKAKIDIDLAKCNFCGICDIMCPYGALKFTLNGGHDLSVVSKESYPELVRDIKVDTKHCPKECTECENVCPLGLISAVKVGFDGRAITNFESLTPSQKERVQINLSINKERCPTCRVCEFKCEPGVIRVRKFVEGKIAIDQSKCPEGCTDCLDVCPISGALYLSDDGKKVHVNELFCDYCGACKVVCPVDDAMMLKRTKVLHTPIHSGTWNKALERITSPEEAVKELKATGSQKLRQAVGKRFVFEEAVR